MSRKLGALILAGGASRRMGQDKARLEWGGLRAVDISYDLARRAGAAEILVSGGDYGLPFISDPHLHSGPVSGVMTGASALATLGCETILVLAVDAPAMTVPDIEPLLAADGPGAVYDSGPLPMVIRRLALPAGALNDWPLRRLVERAGLAVIPCPQAVQPRIRGANSLAERVALTAAFFPPKV